MREIRVVFVALAVAALAALPMRAAPRAPAPIATEQLGGTVLSVTPQIAYERAVLRVAGPNGKALSRQIPAGAPITVDLLAEWRAYVDQQNLAQNAAPTYVPELPDGLYRYEVVFTDAAGDRKVHSGTFFVQGGAAVSREAMRSQLSRTNSELAAASATRAGRQEGADIAAAPSQEGSTNNYFSILDASADGVTYLTLYSYGNPGWDVYNNNGIFVIEDFGGDGIDDFAILDGIGAAIGSTATVGGLSIYTPNSQVNLSDTDGGTNWKMQNRTGDFILQSGCFTDCDPFERWDVVTIEGGAPENALHLRDTGQLGVGTTTPQSTLELAPASGNAAFRLNFNGGDTWVISNTGSDVTFNKIGSGGQEMTVRTRNNADGHTFQVQGNAAATAHVNTSSRALKKAFADIDTSGILQGVAELPIQSWVYKEDALGERHIGPTAEDFQEVFGLGDGEMISTVDSEGIALAAIQALYARVVDLEAQLAARDARLSELENRIGE